MDSDTERAQRLDSETELDDDYGGYSDPEAYWRRRVYVLAGGIALIGLVAWACSGPDHKRSTAQVRNAAATMSPTAVRAPSGAGAAPTPTATVTVTATPTAAPGDQRAGDRCDASDVVVGLTPTGTVFTGRRHPRFGLSVVNTGRRTCAFDVGPKSLLIRISSGADRVWSSARCVSGAGPNLQMLRRGVPYLATLDWDRRRCDGDSQAAAGTYVIAVGAAGVKTRREVFRLR